MVEPGPILELVDQAIGKLNGVEEKLTRKLLEVVGETDDINEQSGIPGVFPLVPQKTKIMIEVLRAFSIPSAEPSIEPTTECVVRFNRNTVIGRTKSVCEASANPVWNSMVGSVTIAKAGGTKSKSISVDALMQGVLVFEIVGKTKGRGSDDVLAQAVVPGLHIASLWRDKVELGVQMFSLESNLRTNADSRMKVVVRFTPSKRFPVLYDTVLAHVFTIRKKLQTIWIELDKITAANKIIEQKNAAEGSAEAPLETAPRETSKKVRDHLKAISELETEMETMPHAQYCGMQKQMTEFRKNIETVSTLAALIHQEDEKAKGQAWKGYHKERENMVAMVNVGSLRFSLIEKVRLVVTKYKNKICKAISQALGKQISELTIELKRNRYNRKLNEPCDVLKSHSWVSQSKKCERRIKNAEHLLSSNKPVVDQRAAVMNAREGINALEDAFWNELVAAMFRDWTAIARQAEAALAAKQKEYSKTIKSSYTEHDSYREKVKRMQDELSAMLAEEDQQAHVNSRVPQLTSMYKTMVYLATDEMARGQLVAQLEQTQSRYASLKAQSEQDDSREENMAITVRIEELRQAYDAVNTEIAAVGAKIKEYKDAKRRSKRERAEKRGSSRGSQRSGSPEKKRSSRERGSGGRESSSSNRGSWQERKPSVQGKRR
jgi:hypothetical protein